MVEPYVHNFRLAFSHLFRLLVWPPKQVMFFKQLLKEPLERNQFPQEVLQHQLPLLLLPLLLSSAQNVELQMQEPASVLDAATSTIRISIKVQQADFIHHHP